MIRPFGVGLELARRNPSYNPDPSLNPNHRRNAAGENAEDKVEQGFPDKVTDRGQG